MTTYACVSPSRMKPLRRVDSSISSITLSWEEPDDDGGCLIESYAIYRNDGEGGAIDVEVNTDNDSNISLRTHSPENYVPMVNLELLTGPHEHVKTTNIKYHRLICLSLS